MAKERIRDETVEGRKPVNGFGAGLFGVAMFVAQFKQLSPIELIMNGWPAAIVLLGIEILLASYFAKDENPRFKYDFFSIVVVTLASLSFYALDATGLLATAKRALAASEYVVEIPEGRLNNL